MTATPDSITVLHVDDEPDFAEMAAAFLEREDDRFDVETASSASEGLDRIDGGRIDCLVSDYDMPGNNGIEFLNAVREEHPDVPFILFTGKGSEEVASEAISAGATDYLRKGSGTDRYELLANRIGNAVEQFRDRERRTTLERLRAIVNDVNQALVHASSREGIERQVCDILADADPYRFAVFAGVDRATMRIDPRTWAGEGEAFLDAFEMRIAEDAPGRRAPGGRAFHDREVAVAGNIQSDPAYAPWRDLALEHGFRSLAVVPLAYDADLYGLLAIMADRPHAFDATERDVLAELGDDIAHAIHAQTIQTELRESERRFEAIFEDPGLLIGVLAPDGTLLRANETAMEFIEADRDDVIGEPFPATPWWTADIRDDVRQWIADARSGEYVQYEADLTRPDGEGYSVAGTIRPVTDGAGEVVSLVVSARDVTERRQYERRLEQQNERLEKFASIVSHDLRNPLNIAEGRLELAMKTGETEHLEAVTRAHERMRVLIEELLTRARENETAIDVEEVGLASMIDACWRDISTAEATLAAETEQAIRADRNRLQQLLGNLFRNSVEHGSTGSAAEPHDSVEHGSTGSRPEADDSAEHGGASVTVTVGDLPDGFYVADDGPGIPADVREEVFETGYSTAEAGTGFGLAIAKEVADAHGWEISVTDSESGGARFEITGVESVDR